ncbi:NDMA-dependent alcohol dehydrogenase [Aeromicrobium sp. 636]|uniref:NDMA-dependent alcohol dehydrogenase n=1 Tax=Aeromicrobium senzhongii TaxID=2663859 RepID=A0A8I0EW77_9ACTN|nr:NDMA-dependent alcohol dehydrogenase [Aeromicrobium sp. 636]MBC9226467.1 NDMA-dependent alcohol dehydrogenase [Aeromicrobium senzhongii]MCQ3998571.1 NDMA-dependent alcohol dehydrogenase [Aeromicrobium sp. 636]
MQVRASVLTKANADWTPVTLELDPPKAGEVLVRVEYAGMCRSDEHRRHGNHGGRYPLIGGHEGSGVVVGVGAGVTRLKEGDHVILGVVPQCGVCKFCASGRSRMCDLTANTLTGMMQDGTYRYTLDGDPIGGFCIVGSFADHVVVGENSCIKIPEWFPLEPASLLSCGIPTGWGSAEYLGEVRPGDTVMVVGIGGIGINAVQGAAFSGASHVIAVDPVEWKTDLALKLGATHKATSIDEASELARSLSMGTGADVVIETVGVLTTEIVSASFAALGKSGRYVLTGTADDATDINVQVPGNAVSFNDITIRGSLLGGCSSHYDIPRLARLYDEGHLKIDELITKQYSVDEVAQGYDDVREGRILRGVVKHDHT